MKTTSILVLVALATSGCATSPSSSLPACDGKHRRPANPHGSVLVAPAPAAGAVAPSAPAVPQAATDAQPSCGA
jgi:hypothetical protein